MSDLSERISQLNKAGIENLFSKGVIVEENSTTTDIINGILDIANGGSDSCVNKHITENGEYIAAIEDEAAGYKQVQVDVTPRNSGLPLNLLNDAGELTPSEEVTDVIEDVKYIFPNINSTVEGTPQVGETLTVNLENINKYAKFEYQWYNGKAVQAVETDSNVYIDTGYIPKTTTKIVMEYTKTVAQNENAIFGCGWGNNSFFLYHYNGNLRYHSNNTYKDFAESTLTDKRHIELYNGVFTVNDQMWTHTSCANQTNTLKIFGPLNSNNYKYCGKFSFKFMKIYEYNSDTKQFDLIKYIIPTISQETEHIDEVCLYDTVSNTYLYGIGTGELSHNDEIIERTPIEGATDTTYIVKDTDEILVCDVDGTINTECDYTSKTVKINGKPYITDITDLPTTLVYSDLSVDSTLQTTSNFYDINDDNCTFDWHSCIYKYDVSHTPNISDDGVQNGNYSNNYTMNDVVTIDGAQKLLVKLTYGTESVGCDPVTVFSGKHPDYTYNTGGYVTKVGGSFTTIDLEIEGDSVTFVFRSDHSSTNYGYYAKVSGVLNGDQLSDEHVYTLTENDMGKTLQCTVNGKDHYIGSNICSILIPCNLTFMVNDEIYHTVTGNTFDAPTDPTVEEGYVFYGWYDENDNKIEFPYQPVENKTLYARIDVSTVLTELQNTNTTDIFMEVGGYSYKKAYDDISILGMSTCDGNYHNPVAVSRTQNGAAINRNGSLIGAAIQTTIVNNETWYFICNWGAQGTPILHQNTINLDDYISITGSETSKFGELAAQTLIKIYLGEIPLMEGNS